MTTFLANFDFDDRLAGKAGGTQARPGPPDENAVLWRLAAESGDRILVPGLREPVEAPPIGPLEAVTYLPMTERKVSDLEPWGWDELALKCSQDDARRECIEAARRMNDRKHAFDVGPMPRALFCENAEQVIGLATDGTRLMLKPRFGGFGRGLRRVLGVERDSNLIGWVQARCREGGLIIEPLVVAFEAEWARHWTVETRASGLSEAIRFDGWTRLRCDEHGQFQSSRFQPGIAGAPAGVDEVPDGVLLPGYSGKLSIDQCVFCGVGGESQYGPVRDINARWTVGRLVLTLGSRLLQSVSIERLRPDARSDEIAEQGGIVLPPISPGQKPRWMLRV